jgi:aminomethyltransferase
MVDRGIPRAEYDLLSFDKKKIGKVTSGTLSPTLNESIGIGYVELGFAAEGSEIFVDIRGRPSAAKVVKTPFVSTTLTEKKK